MNNKTYDGLTAATISSNGSLSGVVGSDQVSLNSGGASATFDNANVGTTHTVTASGYTLGEYGRRQLHADPAHREQRNHQRPRPHHHREQPDADLRLRQPRHHGLHQQRVAKRRDHRRRHAYRRTTRPAPAATTSTLPARPRITPSAATGGSFTACNYSITYDNAADRPDGQQGDADHHRLRGEQQDL